MDGEVALHFGIQYSKACALSTAHTAFHSEFFHMDMGFSYFLSLTSNYKGVPLPGAQKIQHKARNGNAIICFGGVWLSKMSSRQTLENTWCHLFCKCKINRTICGNKFYHHVGTRGRRNSQFISHNKFDWLDVESLHGRFLCPVTVYTLPLRRLLLLAFLFPST